MGLFPRLSCTQSECNGDLGVETTTTYTWTGSSTPHDVFPLVEGPRSPRHLADDWGGVSHSDVWVLLHTLDVVTDENNRTGNLVFYYTEGTEKTKGFESVYQRTLGVTRSCYVLLFKTLYIEVESFLLGYV